MGLKKNIDRTPPLHPAVERDFERDEPGLLAQLRQGDASQRRWAARDLAAWPDHAKTLCAQLRDEADAGVREALFTSLAQIASAPVVHGLLPLLRSEDAQLRNGATEVLAGLPALVAPQVDTLLADTDDDVRIFAVNLLGDLRHPNVPAWLAQVLHEETAVNVVGAALDVAAEVATPALLPALQAAAHRFADEPYIAFAARLACRRIEAAG